MNLQASPLHARFCPDQAVQLPAVIVENVRLARDTFRVRLHAPEIARRIVPGQFVMARIAGLNDPLIGRPLALYDTVIGTDGQPAAIDLVYLVKGKLTTRLCGMQPGQLLDVWGPLGNGFGAEGSGAGDQGAEGGVQGSGIRVQGPEIGARTSDAGEGVPRSIHHRLAAVGLRGKRLHAARQHLILVAGGIGQTPFLALAQEALHLKRYGEPPREVPRAERITFCYGARTADYLAGVEDFERLGIDVRIATDDGSRGHPGLVTELLEQVLGETQGQARIACCGPEPMMEAVARIAARSSVPCQVSLETPMACGIGICFTCVAKVRQPEGGWDYKRTCVEGPVFDAAAIEWQ